MKVALIQFARGEGLEANVERMFRLLEDVKGVDLVALPENWACRGVISASKHREIVGRLIELASSRGFTVVAGANYVEVEGGPMSLGAAVTPNGEVYEYDKHFPSSAIGERGFLRPGSRTAVFEVAGVRVGVVVCVDLMYPEVVRRLTLRGAEVVVNPSNITLDRVSLWRAIGRARAAENTVFLASVNNTSTSYPDGRRVAGGSFIASPEGDLILEAGEDEGVYVAELDLGHVARIRARWSFLEDVKASRHRITEDYYATL